MIDGVQVNKGDTVWVLGIGQGVVTLVSPDGSFRVKTGYGETHYARGGLVGTQRRVFWADPVVVVPPKDPVIWGVYKRMAEHLYEELLFIQTKGRLPDEEDME